MAIRYSRSGILIRMQVTSTLLRKIILGTLCLVGLGAVVSAQQAPAATVAAAIITKVSTSAPACTSDDTRVLFPGCTGFF